MKSNRGIKRGVESTGKRAAAAAIGLRAAVLVGLVLVLMALSTAVVCSPVR